jgi:integrase/recombinase XerD
VRSAVLTAVSIIQSNSPTLGFTHLQFEAMLTAARESPHRCNFALVAMLGLLGLRIFEAAGANIADLGEAHGQLSMRGHVVLPAAEKTRCEWPV